MSQAEQIIFELEQEFYRLYLIETLTGKSVDEVLGTYSLPTLIRLSGCINELVFL